MARKNTVQTLERDAETVTQEQAVAVLEQEAEAGTLTDASRRKLAAILDPRRSVPGLNGATLQQLQEDLLTLERCQGLRTMDLAEQRVIQAIFGLAAHDHVRVRLGYSVEELLELERTQEVSDEMRRKLSRFVEDVLQGLG